jgi:hypothetical protein
MSPIVGGSVERAWQNIMPNWGLSHLRWLLQALPEWCTDFAVDHGS